MKIQKKITTLAASLGVLFFAGLVPAVTLATPAFAADCSGIDCVSKGVNEAPTGGAKSNDLKSVIGLITNVLLFLIGAVAVIMIVVGGLKYVTSNGNADQVKSAKNTITYAIVGIIIAILAYAIVRFVVDKLT